MKKITIISLVLVSSLAGIAQTKSSPKHKPVAKKQAPTIIDAVPEVAYEPSQQAPDTLNIISGKRYVFLIDVAKGENENVQTIGGSQEEEEKELLRNFGKENLEIIKISNHIFILFENKQTLDLMGAENSFQAFAYWGGQLEDDVQVQEGTRRATEFVAKQLGVDKESSYVANTRKYREEVEGLKTKQNITENSKHVMDKMLCQVANAIPKDKGEDADLFLKTIPNIKSIKTSITEGKTKRTLKSIDFNEQGQPILVKHYSSSGKENGTSKFVYEKGMLIKKISGDGNETSFGYDDGRIISFQNVGDANETNVFWLENNELKHKEYTIMTNDEYSYMNMFVEERIENGCEHFYINERLWSINCGGKIGKFPYVHTYTSFQDGAVLQFRKSKIEQKDAYTYLKYYSKAEAEDQKDDFALWETIKLNDQNLVSSLSITGGDEKRVVDIAYTFYP